MKYLDLFITFFKIGLTTFGGGYAIIPQIKETLVDKRKLLTDEEMVDMIAISNATPGVISVNLATFVGYRIGKILGATIATLALIIPSIIIITLIAMFFMEFMKIKAVNYAFWGLRIGVIALILRASISLAKKMKYDIFSILVIIAVLILTVFTSMSAILILILAFLVGIIYKSVYVAVKKK